MIRCERGVGRGFADFGFSGFSAWACKYLTPPHASGVCRWLAEYSGGGDGGGGARNCGFWTYEQCMATVSGIGGYCEVNAMYRGPSPGMIPPPLPRPRRDRVKSSSR